MRKTEENLGIGAIKNRDPTGKERGYRQRFRRNAQSGDFSLIYSIFMLDITGKFLYNYKI